MTNTFLLFVLTLVSFRSVVYSKTCMGRDQCSCQFDTDSTIVDITSIGHNDGTPRYKDVQSNDGSQYSYNPCYPFDEGQCSQVAVCQTTLGIQTDIGAAQNVQFNYDEGSGALSATYTEGGGGFLQTTTVNLVCDPHACSPQFSADGLISPGSYQLTLTTVCACPDGCDAKGPKNCTPPPSPSSSSGTLGGGSVFLIVFFSLLVVYFVGGVIFMKFIRKAEGSDVIPNKSFWVALPSSIKGGFLFVLRPVLRRCGKYDSI